MAYGIAGTVDTGSSRYFEYALSKSNKESIEALWFLMSHVAQLAASARVDL